MLFTKVARFSNQTTAVTRWWSDEKAVWLHSSSSSGAISSTFTPSWSCQNCRHRNGSKSEQLTPWNVLLQQATLALAKKHKMMMWAIGTLLAETTTKSSSSCSGTPLLCHKLRWPWAKWLCLGQRAAESCPRLVSRTNGSISSLLKFKTKDLKLDNQL